MIFTLIYSFTANITKPIENEIWYRGQSQDAIIEWLRVNETLPKGFPSSIDIWFVDLNKAKVVQITTGNPSKFERWVFDPVHIVPDGLKDGKYYVALINSNLASDIAYSKMVEIKGGTPLKLSTEKPKVKKTNIAIDPSSANHFVIYLSILIINFMF